jgi:hypothetical protein
MPKTSVAAQEMAEFALPAAPMPPPDELTEEEARDWVALVSAFPGERFGPDDRALLVELVRHQATARKLAEELDAMRRVRLIGPSPERAKARQMFCQLARYAREESRVIMMLSVELRLADQSSTRKIIAERERERTATGPRPWDTTPGSIDA